MIRPRTRPAREGLPAIARRLGPRPALPRLLDTAEQLAADPSAVTATAARILASPTALAQIGSRSVWHPNGLAKIVLHRDDGCGVGVRLHVWPDGGSRGADSNPHSHRWEFASALLVGPGLRVSEYAECAAGEIYQRCSYDGSRPDVDGLVETGEVGLRHTGKTVWAAGAAYACTTSVVHTVEPLGHALMATLVLQGPRRAASTVVYRRARPLRDERPVPLDQGELERILDDVVARLPVLDEDPE